MKKHIIFGIEKQNNQLSSQIYTEYYFTRRKEAQKMADFMNQFEKNNEIYYEVKQVKITMGHLEEMQLDFMKKRIKEEKVRDK